MVFGFSLDYYGVMRTIPFLISGLLLAVLAQTGVHAQTAAPAPSLTSPASPPQSVLNSTLFYQLLLSEISATNEDAATAYALMLDAARRVPSEQLFERAVNIALHARSGDSALEAARAWSQTFPTSQNANRYLLQILIGLHRLTDSQEPLERSISLAKAQDRLTMVRVIPRYYSRAKEKALVARLVQTALAKLLQTKGEIGGAAWATVGQMRLLADDRDGALEAVQQGLKQYSASSDVALLALELWQTGDSGLEKVVQDVLDVAPNPELRLSYARKLFDTKQSDLAYAQLQILNQEKPDLTEAWLLRASIELQNKQWSLAMASLQTYADLEEAGSQAEAGAEMGQGLVQAYLLLSQVAAHLQQYHLADRYLQRIRKPSEFFSLQTRRALLLAQQGRLEEARQLIRDLPENQPTDARTKLNAELQVLRERKEHQAVYDLLKQSLPHFPDDVDLLYDSAIAADRLAKYDEMERILRHIMQIQPDYYHAYNALGYSLADRNIRLVEARSLIAKALSLAPKDAHIVDSMGWLEYRQGQLDAALRYLEQAFEMMPDAEIAAHWGEVLWAKGMREEAIGIWNKGLELNRENATLQETLQRLRDAR